MSTHEPWIVEPPAPLLPDVETLWGEFYANLDAARDEEVPEPEHERYPFAQQYPVPTLDEPVPYWPTPEPVTTEQLRAALDRLADSRRRKAAQPPVCAEFVPASGGARRWCETCGWRDVIHTAAKRSHRQLMIDRLAEQNFERRALQADRDATLDAEEA